jgi:hypothetical protein
MSAIKKEVSFEDVTYSVGELRRVGAAVALEAVKDGTAYSEGYLTDSSYDVSTVSTAFILSGSGAVGKSAASGQLFVTSSMALTGSDFGSQLAGHANMVVCFKK